MVAHRKQRVAAPIRVFPISVGGRPLKALLGLSWVLLGGGSPAPSWVLLSGSPATLLSQLETQAASNASSRASQAAFLFLLRDESLELYVVEMITFFLAFGLIIADANSL